MTNKFTIIIVMFFGRVFHSDFTVCLTLYLNKQATCNKLEDHKWELKDRGLEMICVYAYFVEENNRLSSGCPALVFCFVMHANQFHNFSFFCGCIELWWQQLGCYNNFPHTLCYKEMAVHVEVAREVSYDSFYFVNNKLCNVSVIFSALLSTSLLFTYYSGLWLSEQYQLINPCRVSAIFSFWVSQQ